VHVLSYDRKRINDYLSIYLSIYKLGILKSSDKSILQRKKYSIPIAYSTGAGAETFCKVGAGAAKNSSSSGTLRHRRKILLLCRLKINYMSGEQNMR
jgi:hypothetical protein